jgi:alpha-L-rhamnosidase
MLKQVLRDCSFPMQESGPDHPNHDETMVSDSMHGLFREPPPAFGPVPFYWWAGETLDRQRVAWQLDELCRQGVRRTIVSYPHRPDGTCDAGDPALFSPEWWEFFRWFLAACRERGMTAGFQDYNLMEPVLAAIGRETPGMRGGRMSCAAARAADGHEARLHVGRDCLAIGAWAYPVRDGVAVANEAIDLSSAVRGSSLCWQTPAGDWLIALVFLKPAPFDPLHPEAGLKVIERFFMPFERECGADLGVTLDLFFQDELDFGSRMPFWSEALPGEFHRRTGYDAIPLLPALWHDLGPVTEKFRLDYADVVGTCVSERFFEPVFQWHECRGILYGHDNCGRGRIADGRAHYGDYFRTMRWFSAPGCDDPKLDGPRAFRGLKVNSSIAHLYRRPRVWVEAFHSSGWGTSPADIVAAINEDFAYGATVVNLHGLYYSTRGGWWEWAPPDFHFRQPYWRHGVALNSYFTRVCWLLSQGVHRCDVAIVYPTAALDAEPANPDFPDIVAHTGNEPIGTGECADSGPEDAAFRLAKHLFDHACDFDFIDCDSLAGAVPSRGVLEVSDARYRVLMIPAMKAVRLAMLRKTRDFLHSGGLVIAYGCLPAASDGQGRDDAELKLLLDDIFGSSDDSQDHAKPHPGGGMAMFIRRGFHSVLDAISGTIRRGITASIPLHVLHRHLDGRDIYFAFNPSGETVEAQLTFACGGRLEQWDAWTGEITPLACEGALTATLGPREARIFVSNQRAARRLPEARKTGIVSHTQRLDGPWHSLVHPTLDNRFGDFSLPASPGWVGPQARRFRYQDETEDGADWISQDFDDSSWPETTFSFGPQMEYAGPFPPDSAFREIESRLLGGGDALDWRPYPFSRRWGIERDPFLTDWLSGPHGLKGLIPDEFMDFRSDVVGSVWYLRGKVIAERAGPHTLLAGARCAYQVWLNGETACARKDALGPGIHSPWNIPHYDCDPVETIVNLREGANDLLVKLVQPAGQRTRAYVAFDPPPADPGNLALRWFAAGGGPRPCHLAGAARRAIRFRFMGPPGLSEIGFVSRGPARLWVGGEEIATTSVAALPDGCIRYRAVIAAAAAARQAVAIRVEAPADSHAGDALPEPVALTCGAGLIHLGDWCAQGLATYSGAVEYKRYVYLTEVEPGQSVHLDLGALSATAEVKVNGQSAGILIAPPWTCDLTRFLHPGENELSITVANTLANHYSVGIPTPYAFVNQTPSGLFGPVILVTTS